LNGIQISLQIINRYGKRKGILNNKTDCGSKPSRKPSPAQQPPPSPHSGAAQRGPAEAACPSRSDPPWASSSPRRTGVVFLLDTEPKQQHREGKSSPSLIFKGIRVESKPNAHRDRRPRRLRIGGFSRINSDRCRGNFYPQSQQP
jgi:hypothetical protein